MKSKIAAWFARLSWRERKDVIVALWSVDSAIRGMAGYARFLELRALVDDEYHLVKEGDQGLLKRLRPLRK